jgi:hypothetical protein
MRLLICHDSSLEQQKLHLEVSGKIPGDLCIGSVPFSKAATQLCLALRQMQEKLPLVEVRWLKEVLKAAGRYNLMLRGSTPTTPKVVADIEARALSVPWDRPAIIANCCQYSVRLNGEALRRSRYSLSLASLAMCLFNGEILHNSDKPVKSVDSLTTSSS